MKKIIISHRVTFDECIFLVDFMTLNTSHCYNFIDINERKTFVDPIRSTHTPQNHLTLILPLRPPLFCIPPPPLITFPFSNPFSLVSNAMNHKIHFPIRMWHMLLRKQPPRLRTQPIWSFHTIPLC